MVNSLSPAGALSKILEADNAYYNTGTSIMSDREYDDLRAFVALHHERDDVKEYLSKVGHKIPVHLEKVAHVMHMGSLSKALNFGDAKFWFSNTADSPSRMIASYKMDGSSAEAVYLDGNLIRVVTRGDGQHGSDITRTAKNWKNLPHKIRKTSGLFVVRGEAVLPISSWNEFVRKPGEVSNPRNSGNGIVSRKTDEDNMNSHIVFFAFDASEAERTFSERETTLVTLQSYGFNVVPWKRVDTIEEAKTWYDLTVSARPNLDFEIDGVVLAVSNQLHYHRLGFTDSGTRPNGQVAWKFEAASAETTVIGITITQGHTGAIIPTAKLAPIQIGGVTVQNCLLNNFQFIKDLNLNIGDRVEISRRGDVIPYVERVISKNSDGPYPEPACCPFCDGDLANNGKALLCQNEECEGRQLQLLKNWINKNNIKFLGDELLKALYNGQSIHGIVDLYNLSVQDLAVVPVGQGILGESMATKIVAEISRTKEISVEDFMGSLGIKFLGRSMCQHIGLRTPMEYLECSVSELANKPNMGQNKAIMMKNSIMAKAELIEQLLEVLIIKNSEPKLKVEDGKLSGQTFVFTGVRLSKEEKDTMEALGGKEGSSVSANTTYLVQKTHESSSSKTKKAISLGVKVLSLEEFLQLLK